MFFLNQRRNLSSLFSVSAFFAALLLFAQPADVFAADKEAAKEVVKKPPPKKAVEEKPATTAAADPNSDEFINPNTLIEDDFRYNSAGKRDPFLPFELAPKVQRDGPLTPLERYALGELRLTAVVKDIGQENKAIFENAAGQGFTVRVGTRIGEASGVVVKILEDRVQILEATKDIVTGQTNETIKEIKIQSKTDTPTGKKNLIKKK